MEVASLAFEAAQRQHMEALQQLEENMASGPIYIPQAPCPPPKWSLENFLKHQPAMFNGKTSPNLVDRCG